ncbi:hypothetical protein D3C78_1505390 [compost metagenome]
MLCVRGVADIHGLRTAMKQFVDQVIGHHVMVEAQIDEVFVQVLSINLDKRNTRCVVGAGTFPTLVVVHIKRSECLVMLHCIEKRVAH